MSKMSLYSSCSISYIHYGFVCGSSTLNRTQRHSGKINKFNIFGCEAVGSRTQMTNFGSMHGGGGSGVRNSIKRYVICVRSLDKTHQMCGQMNKKSLDTLIKLILQLSMR